MLGEFQDGEVQAAALREFAAGDDGRSPGRRRHAILAMGELSGAFRRPAAARPGDADRAPRELPGARRPHTSTDWSRRELLGPGGAVMKVVASYNLKGGVGKTTAAVNLAHLSASRAAARCSGTSTRRAPRPTCSASNPA